MKCILCNSNNVEVVFHLENAPQYAQKVLDTPDAIEGAKVNVHLFKCNECNMIQIDPDRVSHDKYWDDYLNSRACTELYVQYDNSLADTFINRFELQEKTIVEIGCGDGYFSEALQSRGATVSAIEPSKKAYKIVKQQGINCYNEYVDDHISSNVLERFDAFVTKQVIDLVKNPNKLLKNIGTLLKPGAFGLIDVPSWTKTLIDQRYNSILPDRISYFTASTLTQILERNYFHVVEIFHGAEDEYVGAYVIFEGKKDGLLDGFCQGYQTFREKFDSIIAKYRQMDKSIAAWGAGAKGITIFSFSGVDSKTIQYVIDKDTNRWGRFMPGSLLPITPPNALAEKPVDAIIITAAMFYKEIIRELIDQFHFKGDIILLTPTPHVVSQDEIYRIVAMSH